MNESISNNLTIEVKKGVYNSSCSNDSDCLIEFHLQCFNGRCLCQLGYAPDYIDGCQTDMISMVTMWLFRLFITAFTLGVCLLILYLMFKKREEDSGQSEGLLEEGGPDEENAPVKWTDPPPSYQDVEQPPPSYHDVVDKYKMDWDSDDNSIGCLPSRRSSRASKKFSRESSRNDVEDSKGSRKSSGSSRKSSGSSRKSSGSSRKSSGSSRKTSSSSRKTSNSSRKISLDFRIPKKSSRESRYSQSNSVISDSKISRLSRSNSEVSTPIDSRFSRSISEVCDSRITNLSRTNSETSNCSYVETGNDSVFHV